MSETMWSFSLSLLYWIMTNQPPAKYVEMAPLFPFPQIVPFDDQKDDTHICVDMGHGAQVRRIMQNCPVFHSLTSALH